MPRNPLNHAQRVVCVVGLGLALYTVGQWITGLGSRANFGWVAYAPLSSSAFAPPGLQLWARYLVWLLAIGLWVLLSLLILRESSTGPRDSTDV